MYRIFFTLRFNITLYILLLSNEIETRVILLLLLHHHFHLRTCLVIHDKIPALFCIQPMGSSSMLMHDLSLQVQYHCDNWKIASMLFDGLLCSVAARRQLARKKTKQNDRRVVELTKHEVSTRRHHRSAVTSLRCYIIVRIRNGITAWHIKRKFLVKAVVCLSPLFY